MLAKRVIPCLDVDRGRVVKGTNFLQLRDAGDPVEVASRYEAEGADELVFLDITASHEGREIMLDVVRRTAEVIFMPLTVGGGIRTLDDIRQLLNAGCDKVSINSAAPRDPEFVRRAAERFGSPERFFARFFVANYCPLCFLEASGRNRTPDKLGTAERTRLFEACDRALRAQITCLQPRYVLGIGAFAESRIRHVVDDAGIRVGRILHPSPASPAANRGWSQAVEKAMRQMGIGF